MVIETITNKTVAFSLSFWVLEINGPLKLLKTFKNWQLNYNFVNQISIKKIEGHLSYFDKLEAEKRKFLNCALDQRNPQLIFLIFYSYEFIIHLKIQTFVDALKSSNLTSLGEFSHKHFLKFCLKVWFGSNKCRVWHLQWYHPRILMLYNESMYIFL